MKKNTSSTPIYLPKTQQFIDSSIHTKTSDAIMQAIKRAHRTFGTGRARMSIISGPPGGGKTHGLNQYKDKYTLEEGTENRVILCPLPCTPSPKSLYKELFRAIAGPIDAEAALMATEQEIFHR